jgi:16S rRNA G1207 methylase RsmC
MKPFELVIADLKAELKRYPSPHEQNLQAWDSADELLLQHLSQIDLKGKRILILNDSFGALSCALEDYAITSYTDSYVSFKSIQFNSKNRVLPINQLSELTQIYDLVVARIPKNMSYFEDILCHLSHHLSVHSQIICGYRIKHQANAAFDLLNRYLGETKTSLAQKKARLIFSNFQRSPVPSPYPLRVSMDSFETPFIHHSNLFSREKLDMGTRFFLQHIPQGDYPVILDLGCANGIVGIAAKRLDPSAKLIFSDESQMAIQSAITNYKNLFSDQAEYHWTHCFENQPAASVNLVLCNPPFHQGHTLGDSIARQMFLDAHRSLVPGGILQIIGNSHLPYPALLRKLFGNSQRIAVHPKFTITRAIKSDPTHFSES